MKLPTEVTLVPHDNHCTHAYLEVQIEGKWKKIDATWDILLSKILPISEWDGENDTLIAVSAAEIFSPEKSLEIVMNGNSDVIEKDLEVNGKFYEAFNNWLESARRE